MPLQEDQQFIDEMLLDVLINDKFEFIQLFLDNSVINLKEFLTENRLLELYEKASRLIIYVFRLFLFNVTELIGVPSGEKTIERVIRTLSSGTRSPRIYTLAHYCTFAQK